eukprot:TRINITY_DN263_c0_g1_i3.p2 TRINITY_DN263_c0_g1~~TRINITY_DN263_c0_g1_i3.p2  ORF type:complete len:101 (+),score=22.31 TRINITY_DN263_c0_g1_i3:87-389(+)
MIRRPPRSTQSRSSAASDVYKRQVRSLSVVGVGGLRGAALSTGGLISGPVSHLDAFSAYPLPTWLPGRAPGGTAGSPAVGPPRSSRTKGSPPQSSYAHHR